MKTIITTLVVAVLLLAAGGVAFVYSGLYDVSASSPHGPISSWIMEATVHSSVARRADQVQVPDLGDRLVVLAGVNDFEQMCVQCHGAPGREPDPVGKGLNPPAPDLAESASEMTAAEIFWVTKHGIKMTGMPAWRVTHDDDALWPVVAFVMELPELDAAGYDGLLKSAEGMGHHANGEAEREHPHSSSEDTPGTHEHGETGTPEASDETEENHGNHDH